MLEDILFTDYNRYRWLNEFKPLMWNVFKRSGVSAIECFNSMVIIMMWLYNIGWKVSVRFGRHHMSAEHKAISVDVFSLSLPQAPSPPFTQDVGHFFYPAAALDSCGLRIDGAAGESRMWDRKREHENVSASEVRGQTRGHGNACWNAGERSPLFM